MIGRPNVGKSTLVNRVVGRREAIVEEHPGVTRDRKELDAEWRDRPFRIVDTGGWLEGEGDALTRQVSAQAERAIAEADVVVMVVDVTTGVTDEDAAVARLLRRRERPVLLVASKVDNEARELEIWDAMKLGLGEPIPVSAMHDLGTRDLLDALVEALPDEERETAGDAGSEEAATGREDTEGDDTGQADTGGAATGGAATGGVFAVAIVGRPNVGKSTLFNRLLGEERSIVHEEPGTTRDAVDVLVETGEGPVRFVDTAGMRRRSRVDEATEYYGLVRSLQAVDRADAALLVVDASEGVTHQDQRLAERVDASGCAITIVLNKWDLVDAEQRARVEWEVADRLVFLGYAPVLRVSGRTGRSVDQIVPALLAARDSYHRRVPTAQLNRVLQEAQRNHPAPIERGKRARVLYGTQGATDPPTFTLFANRTVPATYLRYLERSIREAFEFGPTPIKVRVRRRS